MAAKARLEPSRNSPILPRPSVSVVHVHQKRRTRWTGPKVEEPGASLRCVEKLGTFGEWKVGRIISGVFSPVKTVAPSSVSQTVVTAGLTLRLILIRRVLPSRGLANCPNARSRSCPNQTKQ